MTTLPSLDQWECDDPSPQASLLNDALLIELVIDYRPKKEQGWCYFYYQKTFACMKAGTAWTALPLTVIHSFIHIIHGYRVLGVKPRTILANHYGSARPKL
jgi:hypothetical protein